MKFIFEDLINPARRIAKKIVEEVKHPKLEKPVPVDIDKAARAAAESVNNSVKAENEKLAKEGTPLEKIIRRYDERQPKPQPKNIAEAVKMAAEDLEK